MPADDADPRLAFDAGSESKLSDQLNRLAVSLFHFAEDRVELLRWEASHELTRIGSLLVRAFCAALLGFFTLEILALLVIAVFWDTAWRLQVIAAVVLSALLGTVLLVVAFNRKRHEKSGLLEPTPGIHPVPAAKS